MLAEQRKEILSSIRQHLAASAPFDAVHVVHHSRYESTATVSNDQTASLLERFKESLKSVGGHCLVVKDESEAAKEIQKIIEQKEARRIAVSDSDLIKRMMSGTEVLEKVSKAELFDCDLGITSAQWAIAETGTLVLESDKEFHRLTSLVPPVHVAIFEAKQIRQTLGEVLQKLNEKELSRTITFITGPSRTSDIELTLAIGVHGPAELFVIVIEKGKALV
jgi:L-lactate dehydrogenase complex protein LldG